MVRINRIRVFLWGEHCQKRFTRQRWNGKG